jgi:hypothetical protein
MATPGAQRTNENQVHTDDTWKAVGAELRVLILAGIPVGVVVAGIGSRIAMLLLRLTSPDTVRGVTSDDGFTIGRVTVGGTYNLLMIGAAVGLIGAGAYRVVGPRLVGPVWLRHLTVAAACAAVVGAMLVHADGVDFTLLQPTWLAIGLFVALPGLFGASIGPAVEAAARRDSAAATGWRRWLLPLLLVGAFPLTLFVATAITVVLMCWVTLRRLEQVSRLRSSAPFGLAVRAAWILVAVAGLVALVGDVQAIV